MSDTDISWSVLRQIVHVWAGTAAELVEVQPLHGGCVNTTLALTTRTGDRAVIKITPHRVNRSYEAEAQQLDMLRGLGIPTPQVYAWQVASLDRPDSYLLMEFVDGVNLAEAKERCTAEQFEQLQVHLAELVMRMHQQEGPAYRRLTPDSPAYESWPRFYRDCYDPIWHEAEKDAQLPVKVRKQIAKVHTKLDTLLAHGDRPRLVHWDLWSTNILCRPDEAGNWRVVGILDPNCKYAHTEAEIAYLELFKTCTPAFLKAYQAQYKLGADYQRIRKPIYQMYELINHLHLFGREYLPRLQQAVEQTALVA